MLYHITITPNNNTSSSLCKNTFRIHRHFPLQLHLNTCYLLIFVVFHQITILNVLSNYFSLYRIRQKVVHGRRGVEQDRIRRMQTFSSSRQHYHWYGQFGHYDRNLHCRLLFVTGGCYYCCCYFHLVQVNITIAIYIQCMCNILYICILCEWQSVVHLDSFRKYDLGSSLISSIRYLPFEFH